MSGRSTMNVSQEPGPSTSRSFPAQSTRYTNSSLNSAQLSDDDDDNFDLSLFRPARTRNSRDYYPLRHHQLMFDAWEAAHPNGPAPGAGGNLADLQDGEPHRRGGRPPHGLRFIIECAIYGSPERRLTLREIKIAMVRRFAWFSEPGNQGWQNSVRHALSRLPSFQQIKRPTRYGDSGDWWVRTDNASPDITPSARSEKTTSVIRQSSKPGRKPKLQPWSGMMNVLPSTSFAAESHASASASASAPASAPASDDDQPSSSQPSPPPQVTTQDPRTNDLPQTSTRHLPPFLHPQAPDRSLPGLRSLSFSEVNKSGE